MHPLRQRRTALQDYDSRPTFCRVSQLGQLFDVGTDDLDAFAIDCCHQQIRSVYGGRSKVMRRFNRGLRAKPMAESKEVTRSAFPTVVFSTFSTVFIAELGDKTQLATLLLSAQSGSPWLVFLGAALALICSSLVGVLLGQWLARTLPPQRIETMAGVLMVGLGLWLGVQAGRSLLLSSTGA